MHCFADIGFVITAQGGKTTSAAGASLQLCSCCNGWPRENSCQEFLSVCARMCTYKRTVADPCVGGGTLTARAEISTFYIICFFPVPRYSQHCVHWRRIVFPICRIPIVKLFFVICIFFQKKKQKRFSRTVRLAGAPKDAGARGRRNGIMKNRGDGGKKRSKEEIRRIKNT